MSILVMAHLNTNSAGQPLFIVDRDWLKQGSKARKSWTGNVRNRSLYGLAIQVTEYDASEKGSKRKAESRPKRRCLNRQDEASGSDDIPSVSRMFNMHLLSCRLIQLYMLLTSPRDSLQQPPTILAAFPRLLQTHLGLFIRCCSHH